jgi:hypothetical protein
MQTYPNLGDTSIPWITASGYYLEQIHRFKGATPTVSAKLIPMLQHSFVFLVNFTAFVYIVLDFDLVNDHVRTKTLQGRPLPLEVCPKPTSRHYFRYTLLTRDFCSCLAHPSHQVLVLHSNGRWWHMFVTNPPPWSKRLKC